MHTVQNKKIIESHFTSDIRFVTSHRFKMWSSGLSWTVWINLELNSYLTYNIYIEPLQQHDISLKNLKKKTKDRLGDIVKWYQTQNTPHIKLQNPTYITEFTINSFNYRITIQICEKDGQLILTINIHVQVTRSR